MRRSLWAIPVLLPSKRAVKNSALILPLAVSLFLSVAPAFADNLTCPGSIFVGDSGDETIDPSGGSGACSLQITGGTVTLAGALDPVASIGSSEIFTASDSGGFSSLYDSAGRTIDLGTLPGSLLSVTDPSGSVTTYTYDSAGKVISEMEPSGTTTYTYDSSGRVISETDSSGTTDLTYDSGGHMATETDPHGNVTSFSYDSSGNLIKETNPGGGTTTYIYDSGGHMATETDPLGNVTSFSYDSSGNLIKETNPSGGTTTYIYDSGGHIVAETDPLGNVTSFSYDSSGRVISETDPSGTTDYTLGSSGQLFTETDPLGNVTTVAYDALGRVISVTDPITPDGLTSFIYYSPTSTGPTSTAPEPSSMLLLGAGLLGLLALTARSIGFGRLGTARQSQPARISALAR